MSKINLAGVYFRCHKKRRCTAMCLGKKNANLTTASGPIKMTTAVC